MGLREVVVNEKMEKGSSCFLSGRDGSLWSIVEKEERETKQEDMDGVRWRQKGENEAMD